MYYLITWFSASENNYPAFIFLCKGDVVLKDLKLKAEALNSLRLPVTVKAGFVGTITLKVHFLLYQI